MKKKRKQAVKWLKIRFFWLLQVLTSNFLSPEKTTRRHLLLAVRQKAGGRAIELEFYFKINQLLQLYLIFIYIVITFSETWVMLITKMLSVDHKMAPIPIPIRQPFWESLTTYRFLGLGFGEDYGSILHNSIFLGYLFRGKILNHI